MSKRYCQGCYNYPDENGFCWRCTRPAWNPDSYDTDLSFPRFKPNMNVRKKLRIYYSVRDCGDGSASVGFFDSEALANWDDEHQDQPFAESSVSYIECQSTEHITCKDMKTPIGYFLEKMIWSDYDDETREEFYEKFFPDGLPNLEAKLSPNKKYWNIYHGPVLVTTIWKFVKIGSQKKIDALLGSLIKESREKTNGVSSTEAIVERTD